MFLKVIYVFTEWMSHCHSVPQLHLTSFLWSMRGTFGHMLVWCYIKFIHPFNHSSMLLSDGLLYFNNISGLRHSIYNTFYSFLCGWKWVNGFVIWAFIICFRNSQTFGIKWFLALVAHVKSVKYKLFGPSYS